MTKKINETDICRRKHGGVWTSLAAFERAKPQLSQARADVLRAVEMSLDDGITSLEYANKNGKALNAVSGRFTELARDGWIERTGQTRGRAAVWKSV